MGVAPKLENKIDILRKMYVEEKMSTVDIEKASESRFGFYVSRGTIYKELTRNFIKVRTKSVSVSRAMSTLDIDKSFINETLIEWIDGLMLGDGFINFKKRKGYQGARIGLCSSEETWVDYGLSAMSIYGDCVHRSNNRIDLKHPNTEWYAATFTHPDIVAQAKRWYAGPNETKKIPTDCRITPISVMLWYLGDGSFTYTEEGNIPQLRLATCSFGIQDLESILMPKLAEVGINTTRYASKNDIHICSESIKDFFNFIGWKSPISCYDHKFAVPEWLKLIRLSEIVKSDKEKWRAQYYCKVGKVECSKSPGGKMFLFTREQSEKLRSILDENL